MRILVLAGGTSAERSVSLNSGRCVTEALRSRGHDVDQVDPATTPVSDLDASCWEIAVPMVHGTGGEDGVLQRELLSAGIPYVGSSPEASELTFDKIRTNERLRQKGVAVPQSVVVSGSQSYLEQERQIRQLGTQVVTKPPRQGSSIGVSIVMDLADLEQGLTEALQYDRQCLVERYISGREVTVPVIDGKAFPAIEIRPADGWYTYDAKYVDDGTDYVVAPETAPAVTSEIAVKACDVCGVTGFGRVDFIVDESQQPWLLEVNTIPGMTSHSLVPKSAQATGLSLGELCELAIETRLGQN